MLENKGELQYSLSFRIDESGVCIIESILDSKLILECQRCLKPVVIDIHKSTNLGVVRDKNEAESLATELEPLQLEKDTFVLEDLLEDELLLAIPIAPLHPEELCSGKIVLDRINAEARPNPFAALSALKRGKDKID